MAINNEKDEKEPKNIGELFAIHFLASHRLVCEVGIKSQDLGIKMHGVGLIMAMEKLCPLLGNKETSEEAFSSFIHDSGAAIMQGISLSCNAIPEGKDEEWTLLLEKLSIQIQMLNTVAACVKLCLSELASNPSLPAQLSPTSVAVLAEMLAMTRIAAKLDIIAVSFSEMKASLLSEVQTVSTIQMAQVLKELPTTNPQ